MQCGAWVFLTGLRGCSAKPCVSFMEQDNEQLPRNFQPQMPRRQTDPYAKKSSPSRSRPSKAPPEPEIWSRCPPGASCVDNAPSIQKFPVSVHVFHLPATPDTEQPKLSPTPTPPSTDQQPPPTSPQPPYKPPPTSCPPPSKPPTESSAYSHSAHQPKPTYNFQVRSFPKYLSSQYYTPGQDDPPYPQETLQMNFPIYHKLLFQISHTFRPARIFLSSSSMNQPLIHAHFFPTCEH